DLLGGLRKLVDFFAFACALVTPGCTQGNATSFLSLPRRTAHLLGRMNSCGTTLTFNTAGRTHSVPITVASMSTIPYSVLLDVVF
ncbi:hypothetical protein CPB85DRAFT_1273440, partial [Mucidula mucida]